MAVDGNPNRLEELLRSTPSYTLIGCPQWCSWSLSTDEHEHLAVEGSEVVVSGGSGGGQEEVLEVRHLTAPEMVARSL